MLVCETGNQNWTGDGLFLLTGNQHKVIRMTYRRGIGRVSACAPVVGLFLFKRCCFWLSKIFLVNWKEKDSFYFVFSVVLKTVAPRWSRKGGNADDNGKNCTSGEPKRDNEWKN